MEEVYEATAGEAVERKQRSRHGRVCTDCCNHFACSDQRHANGGFEDPRGVYGHLDPHGGAVNHWVWPWAVTGRGATARGLVEAAYWKQAAVRNRQHIRRRFMKQLLVNLWKDNGGADMIEYALIAAIISLAAV